jgi:hypothetical protein
MTFDLHQLDNLDFDDANELVDDYIQDAIQAFADSPEGQVYSKDHPEFGAWISSLIDFGYRYEGFTLPTMTEANVDLLMDSILPRKITLMDTSEADDAGDELIAFWSFLKRDYGLENADSIIAYLDSIKDQFPQWMVDPNRAGMAKSFMMGGMQAGFDMTTQEGLNAFQMAYNVQQLSESSGEASSFGQLGQALDRLLPGDTPPLSGKNKKGKSKKQVKTKGFGNVNDSDAEGGKKKKSGKKR